MPVVKCEARRAHLRLVTVGRHCRAHSVSEPIRPRACTYGFSTAMPATHWDGCSGLRLLHCAALRVQEAPVLLLDVPLQHRVERLVETYGRAPRDQLRG